MSIIVNKLAGMPRFFKRNAATIKQVEDAQQELKLVFAQEYREYVLAFGAASVYGHELTGICDIPRLNVVNVTLEAREYNPLVPHEWYVIEEAHIDGIVIWQSQTGEVYLSQPGAHPSKIAASLAEYLDQA